MSYSQQGQEPKPMPSVEQSLKSVGWHAKEMNESQKAILNEMRMINASLNRLVDIFGRGGGPKPPQSQNVIPF